MSRKPYVREISKSTWFFSRGTYMYYMAREAICIFILIYTFILLWGIKALAAGPEAYQAFLDGLTSPASLFFHWLMFIVAVFHTTSWFSVTPAAIVVQRGEEFVPGGVIIGAHYAGWVAVTLVALFAAGVF